MTTITLPSPATLRWDPKKKAEILKIVIQYTRDISSNKPFKDMTLPEMMEDMSAEAQRNWMTREILQEILDEKE